MSTKHLAVSEVFGTIADGAILTLSSLCRSSNKYGLFVLLKGPGTPECLKQYEGIDINRFGYFMFDTTDEMDDLLRELVAEREFKFFECTCDSKGVLIDEYTNSGEENE